MRYYNENPQVTVMKDRVRELEKSIKFAMDYNNMIVHSLNEQSEAIEKFNFLPWYKKMFYKFKL